MNLSEAIQASIKKVTRDFTREKRRAYGQREERVSQWAIDRWNKQNQEKKLKASAYKVIPQAYKAVSDNGRLSANVRQIYYAVRPLVLKETGRIWKNSETFTQGVFQDYLRDHAAETAGWHVVYDARGHFTEPHMRAQIGIGTLEVRSYTRSWIKRPDLKIHISDTYPTRGPHDRYKFALFIEKEGFDSLLEDAKIAERYDLAIFSSKGQTTTATRRLVETLSANGVTILVLHDFDIAGLSIAHWLSNSNERYRFKHRPNVVDLGLRLIDVEAMGLQSETQVHKQRKDPTEKFWDWNEDVSAEEADFLRGERSYGSWVGQRVELNAMTSPQFIEWLEGKLEEAGASKVVPDKETLSSAWKRATAIAKAREAIQEIEDDEETTPPPKNLDRKVRTMLKRYPHLCWDKALVHIAQRKGNQ